MYVSVTGVVIYVMLYQMWWGQHPPGTRSRAERSRRARWRLYPWGSAWRS